MRSKRFTHILGLAWLSGAKFGTAILQFILVVIMARTMSLSDFGFFQVFHRYVLFLATIGCFGLNFTIVRVVAEKIANGVTQRLVSDCAVMYIITVVFSLILATLSYNLFIYRESIWITVIGYPLYTLVIVLASVQMLVPETFRGLHDYKYASVFSGLSTNTLLISLVLVLFLCIGNLTFKNAVSVFFISSLLVLSVSIIFLGASLMKFTARKNKFIDLRLNGYTERIKESFPTWLGTLLYFLLIQGDVWIVLELFGSEAAAIYAVCSRFSLMLTFPLMIANSFIKPKLVESWAIGDRSYISVLLRNTAQVTFALSAVPTLFVLMYSDLILSFFFGEGYSVGADVLRILCVGQLILVACGPSSTILIMLDKQTRIIFPAIVGVVCLGVFSFILSPLLEERGVAFAFVIGATVSSLLLVHYCWRDLKLKTYVRLN